MFLPAAALLAALTVLGLSAPALGAEPLVGYPVQRAEGLQQLTIDGRIEAERQAVIAAQTGGRILERPVEAGDKVKKGQLLLRIDDRETRQQSAASDAELKAAEAELAQTKLDLDRSQAMLERQLISQSQFDQAETRQRAALARVNALGASARLSATQESFTKVLAPFDGLIAEISVNVGDLAQPGKPLLTVYNPGRFRVLAPLSLQLLELWQQAAPIAIELPDGQSVTPIATVLLPQTDALAQQVKIRLDLPTHLSGLLPGSFVKVQLPIRGNARLLVKETSVLRRGELTAVYVLDEHGAPQLRQVRLGKRYGDMIEIMAGLQEGETIALDAALAALVRSAGRG